MENQHPVSLIFSTILGPIKISEEENAICQILLRTTEGEAGTQNPTPLLQEAAKQITSYLAGKRTSFDVPLKIMGTEFQRRVWETLLAIPHGETRSYGEIAASIGNGRASRAVGMACACNCLPLFIPCHRVVGGCGKLTGFTGGIALKEQLLLLEGSHRR